MRLRCTEVCQRFWPLFPALALVAGAYWYFSRHTTTTRTLAWILLIAGVSYAFASVVLVIFTRRWAMRGVGQFITLIGDAVLYISVAISVLEKHRLSKTYTDMVRALLVVGGPMLVAGLFWWVFWTWRARRADPHEPAVQMAKVPESVIPKRRIGDRRAPGSPVSDFPQGQGS